MAKYGARNSRWAPFADGFEDTNPAKLPSYGEPLKIGELNKVNESLNFNEGSLPGDNQIVLYDKKFKDGNADVESVYIPIQTAAKMLGAASDDENGMAHGSDDNAPYGGYGYVVNHVGKTQKYSQVRFYPKVKATTPSSSTFDTRGENINFATDKMPFHIEEPACRKYLVIKDFATEAEADAYLDACFKGTAKIPGLPDPAEPAQVNDPDAGEGDAT